MATATAPAPASAPASALSMSTSMFSSSTNNNNNNNSNNGNKKTTKNTYGEDNPLTQLPRVDFPFDDLRKRMADFTAKFDLFVEVGRKKVLEERNGFRARLGEVAEEQRSTQTQITTLTSTLSSHNSLLSREVSEKSEITSQINSLQTHHQTQLAQKQALQARIDLTKKQIEAKLQAQKEYAAKMDAQASLNGPELIFWETYLGVRIEGAGDENVVRVVYTFPRAAATDKSSSSSSATAATATATAAVATSLTTISSSDADQHTSQKGSEAREGDQKEREATFELAVPSTSTQQYTIPYMKPKLETDKVAKVLQALNKSRDIGVLLKGMRGLFAEVMK